MAQATLTAVVRAGRSGRGRTGTALCSLATALLLLDLVLSAPLAWSQEGHSEADQEADRQLLASARYTGIPMSALRHELSVQERHQADLFAIPGVVGVGVTLLDDGRPAILVLVDARAKPVAVPASLDGVPVRVEVSEGAHLLHGGYPNCSGSPCHNQGLSLPVQMGNATSSANTCDSGTLGFKACHLRSLTIGYVSANHVAAGTPNAMHTHCFNGPVGMQEMHPGNFENPLCTPSNVTFTNFIGTLLDYVPITPLGVNFADAAFVASSDALTQWSIRDIGLPATVTAQPKLGSCVKKSGRTTGLTWGIVQAFNVIWVNTFDQCYSIDPVFGGTNLIRGASAGECAATGFSRFATGGDSGSAVLDTSNRLVGLVFGSDSPGIYAANIDVVMNLLGLSVDPAQCSSVATVYPLADAFVAQEQPTTNFGGSSVLRIRNTGAGFGRYSFLKFDVPEHGGWISSARLWVRIESTVQQAAIYGVEGMVWSESTVNWSNWDSSNPIYSFLGNYSNLPSAGGWYSFDVAGAVTGPGEITIGIASQADVGQQDFYSRQTSSSPYLRITYLPLQ